MYHISGEGRAKGAIYFRSSYNLLWDPNERFQFFISNYSRTHLKDVHSDFYSPHKSLLKILLLLSPQFFKSYQQFALSFLFNVKEATPADINVMKVNQGLISFPEVEVHSIWQIFIRKFAEKYAFWNNRGSSPEAPCIFPYSVSPSPTSFPWSLIPLAIPQLLWNVKRLGRQPLPRNKTFG